MQQQAKTADSIAYLNGYGKSMAAKSASSVPIFTIPVVFHVLHLGGTENISDAQINSAMTILNNDYQIANTDTNLVVKPFKNIIGDIQIKFALATKDPSGNCTSGIVRHVDANTDWTGTAAEFAYTWPRAKYLNVYVVRSITIGQNAAGYTFRPGTAPSIDHDAIVCLHDYVGAIGTSNANNSRTLTHEAGHWFGLNHVWTNVNGPVAVTCGDDGISDTPVTKGYTTCPNGTVNAQSCVPGTAENYQNYMDYSYCSYMFSVGQGVAMHNVLNGTVAERNSLSTGTNLIATGVVNPATNCAPIADFLSIAVNGYTVCSGQSINLFKDMSYNATVSSRLWTATNGATITTPSASSTVIWFPNPGTSVVTLSVTGSSGGSAMSRTITVINSAATATNGITESFEGSGVPPNWGVTNPNGVGWVQTSNAALHGAFSFMLDGAISSAGSEDFLNMPTMDFVANPGATLRFSYAYRQKTVTHADVFKVQLSNDCGGTWKDVYAPSASALAAGSGGVGTAAFVPTLAEWKTQDVSSHPNYGSMVGSSSVLGRFFFKEATGGFGNKMYIDSVNLVTAPIGVNELTRHLRLTLSPNPTNASATLNFVLSNQADVKVIVMDVAGKLVSPERAYSLAAGNHNITLNENGTLNKGIYIVSLEYNGTKLARKLIIE
ncbi:MAG: T9SS type A sorting domain-containing protein [Bacteroidia bacterium]|nr:T9SS type A sorting domain-containing protein [Bacteroidia bacterium]